MPKVIDLTPNFFTIITAEEEIGQFSNPLQEIGLKVGGFQVGSDEMSFGKIKLKSTAQQILIGDATTSTSGVGIFQGLESIVYKWRVGDPDNDQILWDGSTLAITGTLTATSGTIGGFAIGATTLIGGTTEIILDSANKAISINDTTFGNTGIQLQYNSGTPRMYVGDGANAFFQFDGTKVTWKSVNSELDASGNMAITGGVIDGTSTFNGTLGSILQPRAETFFQKRIFLGTFGDGLTETPGGGTITRQGFSTEIDATSSTTSKLTLVLGDNSRINWGDYDWEVIFPIMQQEISGTTEDQDIFIGLEEGSAAWTNIPTNGVVTDEHIGFFSIDGVLKTSSSDGATQETNTIAGVTLTGENIYSFSYEIGVGVKFYINGIKTANDHTTNVPTGSPTGNLRLTMGIEPQGGTARWIRVANNYFVVGTIT